MSAPSLSRTATLVGIVAWIPCRIPGAMAASSPDRGELAKVDREQPRSEELATPEPRPIFDPTQRIGQLHSSHVGFRNQDRADIIIEIESLLVQEHPDAALY